ncbi:signal peptidase I [Mycetocola sp. JXN-3]|uniref:signal peptidase I n=1 Tax=Mycetocola sp. JXN-3 TaxID=2116510 RepID=UPI00165D2CFD|nr:signal peptidase I [Mycetocola sp. JXN-3]
MKVDGHFGSKKPVSRVLRAVSAGGVLVVAATILTAYLLGIRGYAVTGASMEPDIRAGQFILTRSVPTQEIRPGEIVTVRRPGRGDMVTHRVITVSQVNGLVHLKLRGDANATVDPSDYVVTRAQRYLFAVF